MTSRSLPSGASAQIPKSCVTCLPGRMLSEISTSFAGKVHQNKQTPLGAARWSSHVESESCSKSLTKTFLIETVAFQDLDRHLLAVPHARCDFAEAALSQVCKLAETGRGQRGAVFKHEAGRGDGGAPVHVHTRHCSPRKIAQVTYGSYHKQHRVMQGSASNVRTTQGDENGSRHALEKCRNQGRTRKRKQHCRHSADQVPCVQSFDCNFFVAGIVSLIRR